MRNNLKDETSCVCLTVGLRLAEALCKRHGEMCTCRVSKAREVERCMFTGLGASTAGRA